SSPGPPAPSPAASGSTGRAAWTTRTSTCWWRRSGTTRRAPRTSSRSTSARPSATCRRTWQRRRGSSTPRSRRTTGRAWARWPSTDPSRGPAAPALSRSGPGGVQQPLNVDLLHPLHGLEDPPRHLGVRVAQQPGQLTGDDLPGQAVAVLQPPARPLLTALGELAPQLVDLLLRLAVDKERDRLVEGELRPAVERQVALPGQLEHDHHRLAVRPRLHLHHPGTGEDRGVEDGGLLSLAVEPEERGDLLHDASFRHVLRSLTDASDTPAPDRHPCRRFPVIHVRAGAALHAAPARSCGPVD